MIRERVINGLIFKEITNPANFSQGSVALEIKQWNKEKAEGKISKVLDDEISEELEEKETPKKPDEIEFPPVPIPVVRY